MKILILNSYGRDDKGDGALLSALLEQLRGAFGAPQISIASVEDPSVYPEFEGYPNVFSPSQFAAIERPHRLQGPLIKLFTYGLLPVVIRHPILTKFAPAKLMAFIEAFREADLVISVGGGYFNAKEIFSTIHLLFVCQYLVLAAKYHKVTITAPVSIGPFAYPFQKWLVIHALSQLRLVLVREDISYRLIEPYLKPHQIMRGVDSGFTYQPVGEYSLRTKLNLKPAQKLVAVSVRKWFDPSKQAVYETAIAEFVTLLIHHHYQVVFIPQCTAALEDDDDRDVALSVASHLKSTKAIHVITDDLTYAQVQLAYHDVDYVVGTRFHSVIFGLTNFTPSIAIEYEHKTRGIMRELGLEDWTINIAAVRGKSLYELFEKLVANRELYRAHLQQVIPPYAARSDEVIAQFRLAAASATIPRPDQPQP